MRRTVHVCQSVRGALLHWKTREWRNVRSMGGKPVTPAEAKAAFLDLLSQGVEVIPFGDPCEGFDYAGGGCPGHDIAEDHP